MILKGNERGYGAELARHLLNPIENDHVTLHAVDGFVANDLAGAFAEAEAISRATQCRNYLYSLSLSPPPGARVTVETFEEVVGRIERRLGLSGQPRAIVFHEKNGRRHAHCVWSRIDPARMRAINLAYTKRKLMDLSRDLYREHGWEMPAGFLDRDARDPLAFTGAEAGQARRTAQDPKALKALFRAAWDQSDSRAGFAAALWAEGFCLARGDRRGFVAVDAEGKIWSLSRWCGVPTKELQQRLRDPSDLPTVEKAARLFDGLPERARRNTAAKADTGFENRRRALVAAQRAERDRLLVEQEVRRAAEDRARQARLPRGLKAIWLKLSGGQERLMAEFAAEAAAGAARDRAERQALIDRHLADRRDLERGRESLLTDLQRDFVSALRPDQRQRLVLPAEVLPFSTADLVRNPTLILDHLSHKRASFPEDEIKRALAAQLSDPLTLRSAIDRLLVSPELVRLPDGTCTTAGYQKARQDLASATTSMVATGGFGVPDRHVDAAITAQDAALEDRLGSRLSDEQRTAIRHVLDDRSFAAVVGLAGAGKSTMLATARAAWQVAGRKVHGAALSGKAAEGLETSSGIPSRTLAALELNWRNGDAPIAPGDVLVVDEAGMVGTRQLSRVAARLKEIGAKLVLVGDPDQLQPIEAGTPFRDLVETHGAARLTEIHRQREDWQRQASRDLAEGRLHAAFRAYDFDGSVRRGADHDAALAALVGEYLADTEAHAGQTRLAFAHRRRDVFALNQAILRGLRDAGDARPERIVETETGPRAIAAGDRIVFTRNDRDIGVRNGMLGTIAAMDEGEIAVRIDGDIPRMVRFDPKRFQSFDHGYAVTIHKSQGATVDRSFVLASKRMDAPLTYVAMTRHRDNLRLYVDAQDRPDWIDHQEEQRRPEPARRGRDRRLER